MSEQNKRNIFIAYGSNLGEREETIAAALDAIGQEIGPIVARSMVLESEPLVIPERPDFSQPAYLNGVIHITTTLAPPEVLNRLLQIEERLGRIRSEDSVRWGPRTIDLDIIAVDQEIIETSRLIVPHPEMINRYFVLQPLTEIAPDWIHPIKKQTAQALLEALEKS